MSRIHADELGFIAHLPGEPEAINADSFDEDALQSPVPVLVEFWAARCGPCRRLAPELAKVKQALGGQARVFTLNVDEEREAAERFDVRAVPATLLFVGGRERARLVGFHDQAALLALVRAYVPETAGLQ